MPQSFISPNPLLLPMTIPHSYNKTLKPYMLISRICHDLRMICATFIVSVLSLYSCGSKDNVAPYGWTPVSAEIDSLTCAIEKSILNDEDAETAQFLLKNFENAAVHYPPELNLKKRMELFKAGVLSLRFKTAEARSIMSRLQNTVDSNNDPYLYNRILAR